MMCLLKHVFIKVISMQPVKPKNTLKMTDCHTQNQSSSIEVRGILYCTSEVFICFVVPVVNFQIVSRCVLSWRPAVKDHWQPSETQFSIIEHQCLADWTLAMSHLLVIMFLLFELPESIVGLLYSQLYSQSVLKFSLKNEKVFYH